MNKTPKSAFEQVGGMAYFPRMLDKIRLRAAGELKADYHPNLGKGADGWCLAFLRIEYEALKKRVTEGGSDAEILEWCFENGRRLSEGDRSVWNGFITKLGWRDSASARLQKVKEENGLGDRADIQTMPDFFDVDEGRKP